MIMQVIFTFFSLFFTIYVYDLAQNIAFVLLYTIFTEICLIVFEILAVKLLNAKSFNIFYRLSFFLIVGAILLVFLISRTTIYMVFVVQAVYALALIGYYLPQEVATMNHNNQTTIASFVGISQILGIIAAVAGPLISGFLIDKISYTIFLFFVVVLAVIALGFSFGVHHGNDDLPALQLKTFVQGTNQIKNVRQTYLAYGFYKFSQDSIIKILIPILLFLKVGTNLSVGVDAALAALVGGVVITIYLIIDYRHPNFASLALVLSTVILIAVTILLVIWASLIAFFIYYFVSTCCIKIISQYTWQHIFTVIEDTPYAPYKKQHHLVFNLYDQGSKLLAYLITLLVVCCFESITILTIIILVVSSFQMVSTILLLKANRNFTKNITTENSNIKN